MALCLQSAAKPIQCDPDHTRSL